MRTSRIQFGEQCFGIDQVDMQVTQLEDVSHFFSATQLLHFYWCTLKDVNLGVEVSLQCSNVSLQF